ncbi:hypothetical protein CBM2609_A20004 [Cupriavidus taiwanensis]|nr:hypothetical protein CBM2609_A20004 [Cupriavidus taiwanensis]
MNGDFEIERLTRHIVRASEPLNNICQHGLKFRPGTRNGIDERRDPLMSNPGLDRGCQLP